MQMQKVHKLVKNENAVDPSTWLEKAADSSRATRITANPSNIKLKARSLEVH
jgi:hypothetical protein